MLKVGLNYMKDGKKGLHAQFGCQCRCNVCSLNGQSTNDIYLVQDMVYKSITDLWQKCVCSKS
jgi:hypothetical protein